ncbi:hypothetical protein Tco_0552323, partial [Tanacetum coccineum]
NGGGAKVSGGDAGSGVMTMGKVVMVVEYV